MEKIFFSKSNFFADFHRSTDLQNKTLQTLDKRIISGETTLTFSFLPSFTLKGQNLFITEQILSFKSTVSLQGLPQSGKQTGSHKSCLGTF